MEYIIIVLLSITSLIGLVISWSSTFKIAYYETVIEGFMIDTGIELKEYHSVKNDFWRFIK